MLSKYVQIVILMRLLIQNNNIWEKMIDWLDQQILNIQPIPQINKSLNFSNMRVTIWY